MVAENKSTANRSSWLIVGAFGVIGLVIGAVGGYFGDVFGIDSLLHLAGNSNKSAFERTYKGMARFAVADGSAANCNGTANLPKVVENEGRVIDQIDLGSNSAKSAQLLDVMRAIVAYRSATIADLRHDKQAFDSAIRQEKTFLQAAGWNDTSHDHFTAVVRDLDGCASQNVLPQERK
jgi:hypothetical protein